MSPFPKEQGTPDYGPYLCSQEELEASYARCRSLVVPVELGKPHKNLSYASFTHHLAANSLLVALAEQIIAPVCCTGPQKDYIYILCDPKLVALKIFAAPELLAAAEQAGVKPGTVFTEESCGTNALALTREHSRLVAIRGEQHYCRLFKDWWCVASPVKDPASETIGYLDISMHAEKELGLVAVHLRTLVNSIEREFWLPDCYQAKNNNPPAPVLLRLPPEIERELTPREREVLLLRFSGFKCNEIAQRLHLSPLTVKTHCQNAYEKLRISSISDLRARLGW